LSGAAHACCALQRWGAELFLKVGVGIWEGLAGFPRRARVCVALDAVLAPAALPAQSPGMLQTDEERHFYIRAPASLTPSN